jgi:hypothetical protein
MRADTRPYFIAAIIQTSIPSAVARLGMPRNLFQLLAPPSDHAIYGRRTRARVINYWHQGANVLPVSLPTTDHPQRKNEENPSRTARACHVVPVDIRTKSQTG